MDQLSVRKCYFGKNILISGGTGFMGKVLVHKLLKDCDVGKVFIFLRCKKDQNVKTRFEKYKNHKIFEKLREFTPECMDKLFPIEADFYDDSKNFGISDENLETLMNETNIIFHCAASVKFDEPVEDAIKVNTIGTNRLLDLAEKITNLSVFVHVSTAYSNINQAVVEEKVYDPIYNYEDAIKHVLNYNEEELKNIEKVAVDTFPNTYIFSKHITEKLVYDRSFSIPTIIVRPSIICPAFMEPYAGWVDSFNGISGMLPGASTGMIRIAMGNSDVTPDLLPCDYAVNSTIVAAAAYIDSKDKSFKVYNLTTGRQNPVNFRKLFRLTKYHYVSWPNTKMLWVPSNQSELTRSYSYYLINALLFQFLPAVFLDLISILSGHKAWALKLQKRIFYSLKRFQYFMANSFNWENDNFVKLYQSIRDDEKDVFDFDTVNLDYNLYFKHWVIGSRRYLMKESDDSIPFAIRKYYILYSIDLFIKITFWLWIAKYLYMKIFS